MLQNETVQNTNLLKDDADLSDFPLSESDTPVNVLPEITPTLKKAIVDRKPIPLADPPTKTKSEPTDVNDDLDRCEIDESNVNFSQNRELWQRRANMETAPSSPLLKTHRLSEPYIQRQNHTPDLVMDLPLVGNASPKEQLTKSMSILGNMSSVYSDNSLEEDVAQSATDSSSEPDSPDMHTAAETFAKQNQCTLKKNKKNHIPENPEYVTITSPSSDRKYATLGSSTTTSTFKPQPKSKPIVLKKPVFSMPLRSVSIEMMCKDPPDYPT